MIPRNIDLTANNEFSGNRLLLNEFVSHEDYTYAKQLLDDMSISLHDYIQIQKIEKIFGRRSHINQKDKLFRDYYLNSETSFGEHVHSHCERCGKYLPIPWKRFSGLCEECNSELGRLYITTEKLPWRNIKYISQTDIFNMR